MAQHFESAVGLFFYRKSDYLVNKFSLVIVTKFSIMKQKFMCIVHTLGEKFQQLIIIIGNVILYLLLK